MCNSSDSKYKVCVRDNLEKMYLGSPAELILDASSTNVTHHWIEHEILHNIRRNKKILCSGIGEIEYESNSETQAIRNTKFALAERLTPKPC